MNEHEHDNPGAMAGDPAFTPNPDNPIPPNWPGQPGWPRPDFPPIDWRCMFHGPVSGRYEGGTGVTGDPQAHAGPAGRHRQAHANSPVMNRVSADHFRVLPSLWPAFARRVYVRSPGSSMRPPSRGSAARWRSRERCAGGAVCTRRPLTSSSRRTWLIGPATVTLMERAVHPDVHIAKRSQYFRDVELEVDVCASVNAPPGPVLRHPRAQRPSAGPAPTDADGRGGLPRSRHRGDHRPRLTPSSTTARRDSPRGLRRSCTTRWRSTTADCAGLAGMEHVGNAGRPVRQPGPAGSCSMPRPAFGGAGDAPERQGFAVFGITAGSPTCATARRPTRTRPGPCATSSTPGCTRPGTRFNFLHSWDKSRPNSLSWMNYDWRYDQRNGADSFWANFRFRFDDEELSTCATATARP